MTIEEGEDQAALRLQGNIQGHNGTRTLSSKGKKGRPKVLLPFKLTVSYKGKKHFQTLEELKDTHFKN